MNVHVRGVNVWTIIRHEQCMGNAWLLIKASQRNEHGVLIHAVPCLQCRVSVCIYSDVRRNVGNEVVCAAPFLDGDEERGVVEITMRACAMG